MLSALAGRLTYGNVVATLALFLALGGTSVAAIQLSKNSVKAKHITKGAVTSSEVQDRALKARDFARGQLPIGEAGPQGPPGVPGATTLITRERTVSAQYNCVPTGGIGLPPICTTAQQTVTASCEPGERAVYAMNGTPVPVGGAPTGFTVPPPPPPVTGEGPVTTTATVVLVCAAP